MKGWSEACSMIFGTIHDMASYYNKSFINQRTPEKRQACLEMAITRYFSNTDKRNFLKIVVTYGYVKWWC